MSGWFVYPSDGDTEANLPDRPLSFDRPIGRDGRENGDESSVTMGIVLTALIAVLLLFGTRVFGYG